MDRQGDMGLPEQNQAEAKEADPDLRRRFLEGMSRVATTVSVVTTDGPGGRAGVTVSAMSSVSADGPQPVLLVCVHRDSPAAAAIRTNGVFCVNLLRDEQAGVSDVFAGRIKTVDGDKFSCALWTTLATGAPLAEDRLVAFDCRLLQEQAVGTHHVFFGAVQAVAPAPGEAAGEAPGRALLYADRAYGTPARLEGGQAAPAHRRLRPFNTRDTYPDQKLDNDLSQLVAARGTTLFLRGQVGQGLEDSTSVAVGDPAGQAEQAMANIAQLLREAGSDLSHVCKIVIYLTDPRYREPVYQVVGSWLRGVYPVSTGLVVQALARPEWLVEIDVTAVIPEGSGDGAPAETP
ncbi:flavin reductase [Algihabitans sp.]|uniref:flavin reductase n=1 Tax=Algihabitans sp. TaxID=2821514 RepID=UPI003BAC3BB4